MATWAPSWLGTVYQGERGPLRGLKRGGWGHCQFTSMAVALHTRWCRGHGCELLASSPVPCWALTGSAQCPEGPPFSWHSGGELLSLGLGEGQELAAG